MKNKLIGMFMIVLLIVSIIVQFSCVYAADTDWTKGAENFAQAKTDNTFDQSGMNEAVDLLYNTLLALGIIAAVAVGIILGIQFMLASSEGKAAVKEKLVPYVAGCVIVFGAFGIWKLVMIFMGSF